MSNKQVTIWVNTPCPDCNDGYSQRATITHNLLQDPTALGMFVQKAVEAGKDRVKVSCPCKLKGIKKV